MSSQLPFMTGRENVLRGESGRTGCFLIPAYQGSESNTSPSCFHRAFSTTLPRLLKKLAVGAALSVLVLGAAQAATLRVSPISAELTAPNATTTFNLRNEDNKALHTQVRVYRWQQRNGKEELVPTSDVVASPPIAALQPGADYLVRVVRVNKAPVRGEESYRVIVDELPDPARQRAGTVQLIVRHVLPVFFRSVEAKPPQVHWRIVNSGKRMQLVASNQGETHLRLSKLDLSQNGKVVYSNKGLMGYVLGGTSMHWDLPLSKLGKGPFTLTASSSRGQVKADVTTER